MVRRRRSSWLFLGVAYFFLGKGAGRIAVGSKDFTEQVILGEILAQAIEAKTGAEVVRRFDLGGNLAHDALIAGEIDVYAEYTGTGLLAILKEKPLADPQEVYRRVKSEYAKRFKLEWTEPLGFNNTFAILVRGDDARKLNLKTVSDAAKVSQSVARRLRPGLHVARRRLSGIFQGLRISLRRRSARWICR